MPRTLIIFLAIPMLLLKWHQISIICTMWMTTKWKVHNGNSKQHINCTLMKNQDNVTNLSFPIEMITIQNNIHVFNHIQFGTNHLCYNSWFLYLRDWLPVIKTFNGYNIGMWKLLNLSPNIILKKKILEINGYFKIIYRLLW